ncbi:hypothetical protein FQN57_004555 [Myotisia sp. PD_48]|nr:hypothetical protein FQN57_004555 [Myotisia sp. PD_48]
MKQRKDKKKQNEGEMKPNENERKQNENWKQQPSTPFSISVIPSSWPRSPLRPASLNPQLEASRMSCIDIVLCILVFGKTLTNSIRLKETFLRIHSLTKTTFFWLGSLLSSVVSKILLSAYLRLTDANKTGIKFRGNTYSLAKPESDPQVFRAHSGHRSKRASPERRPSYPDRFCIYTEDGKSKKPLLIIKYKAGHKMTKDALKRVLSSDEHPLFQTVIANKNSELVPSNPLNIDQENVAKAITQTYHYMIDDSIQYGYVMSREAIIVLYIDWDDPKTLYYHLTIPGEDSMDLPEHGENDPLMKQLPKTLTNTNH